MSLKLTIELPLATVAAIQAAADPQAAKTNAAIVDPCAEAIAAAVKELDFNIKPKLEDPAPSAATSEPPTSTPLLSMSNSHERNMELIRTMYSRPPSPDDASDVSSIGLPVYTPAASEAGEMEKDEKPKEPVDRKALVGKFVSRGSSRISERTFKITIIKRHIATPRRPKEEFAIEVQPSTTVGQIKEKVRDGDGKSTHKEILVYASCGLKDDKTVAMAGIRPGSVVFYSTLEDKTEPVPSTYPTLLPPRELAPREIDAIEVFVKDWNGKTHRAFINERTTATQLRYTMRDMIRIVPACLLRLTWNGTHLDHHFVHEYGVRDKAEMQVSIAPACQHGKDCKHMLW